VLAESWKLFAELIVTPFHSLPMIWGIVPLYFGWALNELTSSKANFRTALQTGFSFIWASLQWLYPYFSHWPGGGIKVELGALIAVKMFVSFTVLTLGVIAFLSGLFRKFPPFGKFLGHTRFANYFMVMIFPMQMGHPIWSWERIEAITLFAIPIWLVLHYGLMPVRK
jgi:hypothetical protein